MVRMARESSEPDEEIITGYENKYSSMPSSGARKNGRPKGHQPELE